MKVFQIRQDNRFAWYETSKEHMENMVNKCNWQGRVLELAKDNSSQPVQQPELVSLIDDREAFEQFWTNPYHGDNSSIEWNEGDGYFSFLTREAYRAWQAGRSDLIAKSGADIRHDKLFQIYSETLTTLGYTSIEADSNGLMAVANYAILAHAAPVAAPVDVPAASVQPGFDMPLRKAVQQMTLALNENEWADLLTTDPDAAALEEAIRDVLETAGQLGDPQPDSGRDAALVLPGCLADRLYEAIDIARKHALHASSVERRKKWDATRVDLQAALATHPANVAQPLKPMGEDGNEWYFDCDGHYIDVKRDESGKYSVYFRNQKDGSEAYQDQADANLAQLSELTSTQRQVIELQSQLNAVLLERGASANVAQVELSNMDGVFRYSDQSVRIRFASARSASAFEKYTSAILAAAKKGPKT